MIGDTLVSVEQITVQYQTMQRIVTDYLRSAIISGVYGPGERLNQDEIARQLRVSRMPVREAIQTLQSEGLVELQPHRSAVVISLRPEDISEIFGLRALLEAKAIELSVPNMTEATNFHLRSIFDEMRDALEHYDSNRWLALDVEFHSTMYASCGWPRLRTLIEAQRNALLPYQRATASLVVRTTRAHEEHHQMLLAAEQRDSTRLARLRSQHLHAISQELIDYLSSHRDGGMTDPKRP